MYYFHIFRYFTKILTKYICNIYLLIVFLFKIYLLIIVIFIYSQLLLAIIFNIWTYIASERTIGILERITD